MPRRKHHSQSRAQQLAYSGAPSYDTEFANLNLSGLETFTALGDLPLSPTTSFSVVGQTSFEPYQPQPAYAPNNPDYSQSYLQHYQTANDPDLPSGMFYESFQPPFHNSLHLLGSYSVFIMI
jgi:hypothetical protein